jgi:hypothetical protein
MSLRSSSAFVNLSRPLPPGEGRKRALPASPIRVTLQRYGVYANRNIGSPVLMATP